MTGLELLEYLKQLPQEALACPVKLHIEDRWSTLESVDYKYSIYNGQVSQQLVLED